MGSVAPHVPLDLLGCVHSQHSTGQRAATRPGTRSHRTRGSLSYGPHSNAHVGLSSAQTDCGPFFLPCALTAAPPSQMHAAFWD